MRSHREIYGCGMFHIEVRSLRPERAPLPITETGYKSIFIAESELVSHGGALQYVSSYIEEEAKSSKWIDLQAQANQYQLF